MANQSCSILVRHSTRDPRSLLHFKRHVRNYFRQLFYLLREQRKKLLAYQVINDTSYLLLRGDDIREASKFVQRLHGIVASDYSKATRKKAPFWKHRPRYTLVQSGDATREILAGLYSLPIDHGRVLHPAGWWSSSYSETLHPKTRYRMIDRQALFEMTNLEEEEFSKWLISIAKRENGSQQMFEKIQHALGIGEKSWINSRFYLGGMQKAKCQSWRKTICLLTGVRNTMGSHQDRILRLPKP